MSDRRLARNVLACTLLLALGCHPAGEGDSGDTTLPEETDSGSTDTTAPTALSSAPVDAEVGVALNRTVKVVFSEALDPASVTSDTFTLESGGTPVVGTVTFAGDRATFTPTEGLSIETMYDVEVSAAVTDLAGNPLEAAYAWSFTSGDSADTTAPTIVSTSPSNYATDIAVTRTVNAHFSEPPDPTTIGESTFRVTADSRVLAGTFTLDGSTATFTPTAVLASATLYDATLIEGILDLAGNAMAEGYAWSFTTGDAVGVAGSVDLQSAADFAVLAGSTVSSTGLTEVTGNLGVSAGTAVVGFPPGVVNGATHAGDPTAAQAELDLTAAYDDAAGRTTAPISVSGNLGGQTLAPGLYTSGGSLEISSGDLTLDAGGDENGVWIFQMPSSFTTTSGRQVILSGGARSANVYWQVGSSATLGSTSVMVGNILADQSITLVTGATLEGRALARIGAVTLDTNVITLP